MFSGLLSKFLKPALPYIQSAVSYLDASQVYGKRPDFDHRKAVANYASWVYVAANLNAYAVASTPLRLYVEDRGLSKRFGTRRVSRGTRKYLTGQTQHGPSSSVIHKADGMRDGFVEVVGQHPLLDLLKRANDYEDGFQQAALRIIYGELTGNAYLHPVIGASGVPEELWTMPAHWVEILPSRTEFIKGYRFGSSEELKREFEPDEVIHFKRPNPSSLYYGMGKVAGGWWIIEQNRMIHEYDDATYRNMARPDYLLSIKGSATKVQLDRFQSEVENRLSGRGKSGRFLALTGDVDLRPLSFPPKDLAGRDDMVEEIGAVMGTPISLLKANDPNLASAKVGHAQWRSGTILPLCRMDEDVLNARLLPLFDLDPDRAFLAYDNPVPADEAAQVSQYVQLVGAGIVTKDEARVEFGYEEMGLDAPIDDTAPDAEIDPDAVVDPSNIETTQETVLNGAQVTAATGIVQSVAAGTMPRDAGIGQLEVLFNLSNDQAERIMGSAGTSTPTTPNPNPAANPSPPAGGGGSGGTLPPDGDRGNPRSGGDNPGSGGGDAAREDSEGDPEELQDDAGDAEDSTRKSARPAGAGAKHHRGGGHAGCGCQHAKRVSELWAKAFDSPADQYRDRDLAKMEALLSRQADAVGRLLLEVGAAVTIAQVQEVLMQPAFVAELGAALDSLIGEAIRSGAQAGAAKLPESVQFDTFTNERVAEAAKARIAKLAESMGKRTAERVASSVAQGLKEGRTIDDIAGGIRQAVGDPARAVNIARTETAHAYSAGEEAAWRESGVVTGKQWLLATDPCQFCEAAAAEFDQNSKGKPLGTPFYRQGHTLTGADGGTMTLDFDDVDGPPLHPSCRCTMIPILESDE